MLNNQSQIKILLTAQFQIKYKNEYIDRKERVLFSAILRLMFRYWNRNPGDILFV